MHYSRNLLGAALIALATLTLTACDAVTGALASGGHAATSTSTATSKAWQPAAYTAEQKARQARAESLGYLIERKNPATFPSVPAKAPAPKAPTESVTFTESDAKNMVNTYMAARAYLLQTGEFTPLRGVSANGDFSAELLISDTKKLYKQGGFYVTQAPTVTHERVTATDSDHNTMQITATVEMPSLVMYDPETATVMTLPARTAPWKFDLTFQDFSEANLRDRWVVDYAAPQTY